MKVTFLGTAGYHPNETRHTTCLLLSDLNIILDAGTGFFRARDHIQPGRLDIFLTHFHSDHVCGLHYLIDVVSEKDISEVHIWGPEGTEKMLKALFRKPLFPVALEDHPFTAKIHELSKRMTHTLRGTKVRAIVQDDHPGGSLGYRFEREGKALVFMTDTVANLDRAAFAKGADLLIHECYFRDLDAERAIQTGHSHSTIVGQFAVAAGIRRLALTHINPLEAEPEFCLREVMELFKDTFLAFDKMEITL